MDPDIETDRSILQHTRLSPSLPYVKMVLNMGLSNRFNVFYFYHAKSGHNYLASKKSVDPDQLTSEKPADQDPHCFQFICKYMLITIVSAGKHF